MAKISFALSASWSDKPYKDRERERENIRMLPCDSQRVETLSITSLSKHLQNIFN